MTDPDAPAELTIRALGFGLALGMLVAAANVYAGLKLGFVDVGTTTIVLLSFAVFGAGRRRFTPQEANVAQVAGSSAGAMAVTAGLIGPIPALAMSGHAVAPIWVVVWGVALAVLGTLVAIPFRDGLITVKRLAFPSARAAGETIQNLFGDGDSARRSVVILAIAALVAAAVTVGRDALHLIPSEWLIPVAIAGVPAAKLAIGASISPLLVGVGLLAGVRVGASMVLGAAIAWVVLGPQLVNRGVATADYPSIVSWTLWPGAALMVASSLTGLGLGGRELVRGFSRSVGVGASAGRVVKLAAVAAAVTIVVVGWAAFGVSPVFGAAAVVLAAVFSVAAMHATGETDNTPSGPLGGLTQVVIGAVGPGGVVTPLHAGGVVNGTAVHAAQMLNAWKAGDVVGSRPARLLVAQLVGVLGGAVGGVVAYWLIREAYGTGGTAMPSPAAQSWKATADAVSGGTATMPAGALIGALAGAIAGVGLTLLARIERLRRYVPSPIAMGIGFIVPAAASVSLALGAIAFALIVSRAPTWRERGTPLASGLIVGEAFAGVVIAAIAVLSR